VPEELDDTNELCPECGESINECECDDDDICCEECGELLAECICDPDEDGEGDEDNDEIS
jgi:hypothetical protein